MSEGIVYYTCLTHREDIELMCRAQLEHARGGRTLIAVSRGQPIPFGDENIIVQGERSIITMHRQILVGLESIHTDVVYLCENDVLYHPSHFDYNPTAHTFCYNVNVWRVRYPDGFAVWADDTQQVSGLCARRETLLDFYRKRMEQVLRFENTRHYEPGLKQTVGSQLVMNYKSEFPNLCIRHDGNLTKSKWRPEDYRNPKYAQGWKVASTIEGWGETSALFKEHAYGT